MSAGLEQKQAGKRIVYIGRKGMKADNVAQTGLTWTPGEIHEVPDAKKADKLLEYSNVWADADKDYEFVKEPMPPESPEPEPRVQLMPQGGGEASPFWEPVIIVVPNEVFAKLQAHEMEAVFMTPEDADAFAQWKQTKSSKTLKLPKAH